MPEKPEKHELTIPVSDLDAGGKAYRFPLRAAWIRGVFEGHEATAAGPDGAVDVRASKSGHDVIVHGTLEADLTVPCARCLNPFALPIQADLSVMYVPRGRLKAELANGDADHPIDEAEADTLPYDGETVVLDDLVRDELLLEIPMIPLCSEACPGISPGPESPEASTQEKGIDPRLAPLLSFKAKATKNS